jgi:tetratricopeptide (TPR) repeat protein
MPSTTPTDEVKRSAVHLEVSQSRRLFLLILLGFVMAVLLSIKAGFDVIVDNGSELSWLWQALRMFAWSLIPWLGLLFITYVTVVRRTKGADEVVEKNAQAVALMQAGEREAAAKIFQELSRTPKLLRAEVSLNRARLFIEQQRFVDALVILEKLLDEKSPSVDFSVAVLAAHAEHQALAGDLQLGEQSYDRAVELAAPARKGSLLYVETLMRLRRGAWKLVTEMPDAEWFSAEGALSAVGMKRMRVLRAFAIRSLPPAQQSAKAPEEIQSLLAGVRPCRPGEFDFLATRWPELKSFLVESGLAFEKGIVTSSVQR